MAHFNARAVQADLLSGWSLVREFGGPGGSAGLERVRVDPHAELAIAETAGQQLEARKRRRGYR